MLEGVFELKKLFSREDIKEKETQMGPHRGSPKGWSPPGDKVFKVTMLNVTVSNSLSVNLDLVTIFLVDITTKFWSFKFETNTQTAIEQGQHFK